VDGHSGVVARRHHLRWRILRRVRDADLLQERVSEGSGRRRCASSFAGEALAAALVDRIAAGRPACTAAGGPSAIDSPVCIDDPGSLPRGTMIPWEGL